MEDYSDYFELRKIHDDSYELTLLNIWNKQILTSNIKKLEKLSNKFIEVFAIILCFARVCGIRL